MSTVDVQRVTGTEPNGHYPHHGSGRPQRSGQDESSNVDWKFSPAPQNTRDVAQRSSRTPHLIYEADVDWRMAPDLELWIDASDTPVDVRLAGVLDDRTGQNVRFIIEELLAEGFRDFAMHIDCLELPTAAGFSCLVGIQRLIKSDGGTMKWSSWPEH